MAAEGSDELAALSGHIIVMANPCVVGIEIRSIGLM